VIVELVFVRIVVLTRTMAQKTAEIPLFVLILTKSERFIVDLVEDGAFIAKERCSRACCCSSTHIGTPMIDMGCVISEP
jgi:hypothetical protein